MTNVLVVTSTELGWDCIVGVFTNLELAEEELEDTQENLEKECFIFHWEQLRK